MNRMQSAARHQLSRVALGLTLLAGTAVADTDWKTFAASECQSNQQVVYATDGSVCNNSSETTAWIHCPTVRDFSTSMLPVEVRHTGRSGDEKQPLKCTLRNMNTTGFEEGDGSIYAYYANLTDIHAGEPASPGSNALLFGRHVITEIPLIKATDFGATIISCELPRSRMRQNDIPVRSCLYNYSVREFDGAL